MSVTITTRVVVGRLCVKELAEALGVSVHYVYQMRACGFGMEWDGGSHCYTAPEEAAREWIGRNGFVIHNGRGQKRMVAA